MKSRIRQVLNGDEGTALFTVVMMSVILFMLITGLLVMQQYYVSQVRVRTQRVSATHIADAGLNDYLVYLKNDKNYYKTHPDTGEVDFEGGSYRVTVTPPQNGNPLTLHATGKTDRTVTIAATVRRPTFADYVFLAGGDIQVGSDDTVRGEVRSNGSVVNDGHITGETYAADTVSGAGVFDQGKFTGYSPVSFDQVGFSKDDVMAAAQADGSYFGAVTSGLGYAVTFRGTVYDVERITDGITTGDLVKTYVGTYTIPADGAIYFESPVWLSGRYGANVTVACDNDIYLVDSYQRTSDAGEYCCGLIARTNIVILSWYDTVPEDMVISAALVAQTGKFYADMQVGRFKNSLTLVGSAAFKDASGQFKARDSDGNRVGGFNSYNPRYDQLLNTKPPPFYPTTDDSAMKVATWVEDGGVNPR